MFTGIIERIGSLRSATHGDKESRLVVDLGPLTEGTRLGDSICVDGLCLTVTRLEGALAHFDASAESRRKTTLGSWRPGRQVNLERALALGGRLGGHLVSGHVDGVGRLLERKAEGEAERFTFVLPDGGSVKVVEKGSIAIDGVSLTTWDCRGARFSIAIIPHTLGNTTLSNMRPGTPVNLEQDPVGRWVEALLKAGTSSPWVG